MNIEEKALAACIEYVAASREIKRLKGVLQSSLAACEDHGSHLSAAYAKSEDEDDWGDMEIAYLGPAEQMEVLEACPHCLAAHNAVQDRKKARQRFGSAKRAITRIGAGKITTNAASK